MELHVYQCHTLDALTCVIQCISLVLAIDYSQLLDHVCGCRWPLATIIGVPAEGVEEFIYMYLGSKQSSNGYCRPDVLRRIGLACSVMNSPQRMWKCSSFNINTKVHLYQALVMSVLLYDAEKYGPSWPLTWRSWGFPHEVSVRDTWCTLLGSCLQCREYRKYDCVICMYVPAIWFVNHRCHFTSSTVISFWPCSRPGPLSTITWSSASDGWYLRMQKATGQLKKTTRPPSQRLAQQGSAVC